MTNNATPSYWLQPNEDDQGAPEEMPPVCDCGVEHFGECEEQLGETDRQRLREYNARQARRRGETGYDTLEEYRGEK